MRRLLLRARLYGTKIGTVWAIYPDDLEAFSRTRRPPGRPRKVRESETEQAGLITGERAHAGTDRLLRKRHRKPGQQRRTGSRR